MNITILSSVSEGNEITRYRASLIELLDSSHSVSELEISQMDIKPCTGCWSCWVKTPGSCIIRDDMDKALPRMINCELLIHILEPVLGFVNYRTKMVMDRSIPLVHPYIELVQNECHHRKRYSHYPLIGVLIEDTFSLVEEDIQTMEYIFSRFALNFKSELALFRTTETPVEEIVNEINGI